MSSGLVIIGKSASCVGVFYEAKTFFHWCHCDKGGENPKYHPFAPKTTFQTILNGSGSLALFKDMAPYQPWMMRITSTKELPRAVVPSVSGAFGSLLLCNENHAPCTMSGCSFWVACPGYKHFFQEKCWWVVIPVAIEKVLSTWPWFPTTRNCLAKWYFPL